MRRQYQLGKIIRQLWEIDANGLVSTARETQSVTVFSGVGGTDAGLCVVFGDYRFEYNFRPAGRVQRVGPVITNTYNFFNSRSRNKPLHRREEDIIIEGWDGLGDSARTAFVSNVYEFLVVNEFIREQSFNEYTRYLTRDA